MAYFHSIYYNSVMETIKTKRLILRHYVLSDLGDLYDVAKEVGVLERTGESYLADASQAMGQLSRYLLSPETYAIEFKKYGRVIGTLEITRARFDPYNRKARELTFYLGIPYQNHGLMTEALEAYFNYVFHKTKINKIYAGYFYYNEECAKLLKKFSFKYETTYNLYLEFLEQEVKSYYYSLSKEDYLACQ